MSDYYINVIVVEDEKRIAKNIAKLIEQTNSHYKVLEIFHNGEDAWDYIQKQPPQVVFTDISMPVMDGIELVNRIHESMSFIRCVILSGYADFTYARSAIRYGVEDYLLKPINPTELQEALTRIEMSLLAQKEDILPSSAEENYKPEEIVILIKEYVQKHYASDISLAVLADNLGFSSSYLTKVFSKLEGTTPSKYIRDYRMGIAKQLLSEPDASINAVSLAVGYPDPFHFSKTFKQTFGVSPSEYKNSI